MIHFINEDGNKALKGKRFLIPYGVKKHLVSTLENYKGDKTVQGYKRLKNLVNSDSIAYNEMKRIKNFFDTYLGTQQNDTFLLNGGQIMKNWIDGTLNRATERIKQGKQTLKDAGVQNAFIKHHTKDRQIKNKKSTIAKVKGDNISHRLADNDTIKYESVNHTIKITESMLCQLKEAANDTFSLQTLSSISSFKGRMNYCIEHLGKNIGRGSSRMVFQIDDEKVLKLAINAKGIAQNQQEISLGNDYYVPSIFPEVLCYDDDSLWIVSQFVLPAKSSDFKQCLGITFEEFCDWLRAIEKNYSYALDIYDKSTDQDFLNDVEDYVKNYDIPSGDMRRLANWGLRKVYNNIELCLLDNGLTQEVYNSYYRRNRRW